MYNIWQTLKGESGKCLCVISSATVVSKPNWAKFEKKIKWSKSIENWYIAALDGIFYESEKKIEKKFQNIFFFKKISKKFSIFF